MSASPSDRRDAAAPAEDASRPNVLFPDLARRPDAAQDPDAQDPDAQDADATHRAAGTARGEGGDGALAREAAWEQLSALLGTAKPADVVDRVATLVATFEDLDQGPVVPPGLVTISEVEGVIRKLHRRVSHLQERNETLTEQLEAGASDDEARAAYSQLVRDHERLLEALSVAGTQEGLRRLERLQQRLEHFYLEREALVQAGFRDADDAIDQVVQIEAELEAVRAEKERLARADREPAGRSASAERPARDDGPRTLSFSSNSGSAPVLNRLGVWSLDEAEALVQTVRQMATQLADLRSEREAVAEEVGVDGADDLVELIRSMEAQLADLYEERERSLKERERALANASPASDAPPAAASSSGDGAALPPEAGTVLRFLGIHSLEEAKELSNLVRGMHERMSLMEDKMGVLLDVGIDDPADALAMIESMEAQLVDLYGRREEDVAAEEDVRARAQVLGLLGIASRDEAEALVQTVRQMATQLADLRSEREAVAEEVGVDGADDLVELIRSMEAQLADLYEERERAQQETPTGGADGLAPWNGQTRHIQTILGVETVGDAEAMAETVRAMHEQLQHLRRQQQRLLEAGLDSPADAVAMIESMENQLVELYRDREEEATRPGRPTITLPGGDTYDQLEQLYDQRERLMDALGVADPDDLIDMVNALASQLDALYAERAEAGRAEAARAADAGPAATGPAAPLRVPADADADADTDADTDATATMLASMEEQLRALYQEKQHLMDLGFDDADDAARRLAELEGQVAVLTDERDALRARLRTAEARRPAAGGRSARRDADGARRDGDRPDRAAGGPPSDTYAPGPESDDDGPRVAPPETLHRLDAMAPDELDALPFGVVQTDDQGVVQYASRDGVRLPGFAAGPDEARGRNFFFDLAPSANNSLFRGRFQRGVEKGQMDTGFLYTFVAPGRAPAVARVQLYRAPDARTTWILHRPL